MSIVIVDYGVGNRTSLRHAFDRLGVRSVLSADPEEIAHADGVVLPGVGSAGPAQKALQEKGLDQRLLSLKQPVLGICLGMQLLADYLEEDDAPGLGILNGSVRHLSRFNPGSAAAPFVGGPLAAEPALAASRAAAPRVPHMGWARLESTGTGGFDDPLLEGVAAGAAVYFAHSYALDDARWALGLTRHGALRFPSVVRCRNFWGCQFHPEKSSAVGAQILRNFLSMARQ
jgi:glutamine amidotransferase